MQEVGKESREREQDTQYVGNRSWLQAYQTSDEFIQQLENPEVDPRTQGDQAKKVSVNGGGGRAGGCQS
jgi:hypothetical protein